MAPIERTEIVELTARLETPKSSLIGFINKLAQLDIMPIAAAITSQKDKSRLPTHISINADRCGLAKDSIVLLEQVRTLDKQRLKERMGELDEGAMNKVDNALSVSFGLSGSN